MNAGELQAEAFRGFTLHINLELLPNQPRGYDRRTSRGYGDKRGPYCGNLPNPPVHQSNPPRSPTTRRRRRRADRQGHATAPACRWARDVRPTPAAPQEADFLRSVLAASLGRDSSEVSDLGVLLFAPVARGTEVSLR